MVSFFLFATTTKTFLIAFGFIRKHSFTCTHSHHMLAHKHITHKFIVGRIISWRGSKQKALTKIEKSWLISFLHYIGNEGHAQMEKERGSGGVSEREKMRMEDSNVRWNKAIEFTSHTQFVHGLWISVCNMVSCAAAAAFIHVHVLVFSCHICKKNWIYKRTKNDNNKQTNKFKTTETCWFLKNDERIWFFLHWSDSIAKYKWVLCARVLGIHKNRKRMNSRIAHRECCLQIIHSLLLLWSHWREISNQLISISCLTLLHFCFWSFRSNRVNEFYSFHLFMECVQWAHLVNW